MGDKYYTTAGGVVIHEGSMLLLDRPARNEVRLPKGHIEDGEAPAVTALREVTEETGYADLAIVTDLGSQLVEFDWKGSHYRRSEHYFLLRLESRRQLPRSAQDDAQFRTIWVPMEEAPLRLTFAAEQATAQRAVAAYRDLQASH